MVYYDQRGSGKTQVKNKTKPTDLTLAVLLEDLRQTIQYIKEKYQTQRVFLAGHSWGTMLGTQYVLKYPQDVVGYIGYGQVTETATQDRSWYQYLKATIEKKGHQRDIKKINNVPADFPNISRDEFTEASLVLSKLEQKYGYVKNNFMPIYRKSPVMGFKDGLLMNKAEKLNEKLVEEVFFQYNITDTTTYELPIYYVLGRRDEWTSSAIAADYFEKITAPKKGLYWIEDAGHFIDTDNPIDFCKTLKEIVGMV